MGNSSATVTIVLVARDDADLVGGAIASLLALKGGPYSILIVDDGSRDGTWNRIHDALGRASGHGHDVTTSRATESLGPERLVRTLMNLQTPYAVIARPEDRSRPERIERLLHVIETTNASVVASNRTRMGGTVIEHAGLPCQGGSGPIDARDIAFHLAWTPTNLGTLAVSTDVVRSFPALYGPRLGEDLGPLLGFRGALLNGCFYLDETLVDFKQVRESSGLDVRSRETCREGLFATLIASRVGMLQDLRDLRKTNDHDEPDSNLVHLEASLKGVLIDLTERWTQARDELWVRDMRPCWVTEEELLQSNRRVELRRPRSIIARMKDVIAGPRSAA